MGTSWRSIYFAFFILHDIFCQDVTSSSNANSMRQQTSCPQCVSLTPDLKEQWSLTSNPSGLSLCEATSSKANASPPTPCLSPQPLLPPTIQSTSSPTYSVKPAVGIVRPILKKTTPSKEDCDNFPSVTTNTPEIKNYYITPLVPQQQNAYSVTGVESSISVNQGQTDRTQEILNQLENTTLQLSLTNKVVDKNYSPSACPNSVQLLNSVQESPEYSFQFQVTPKEIISPTLPNYAQKPFTTPIPTTYSVFTDVQNSNFGSPYHLQSDSSTVEADVSPTIITTVSSPLQSSLSFDTVRGAAPLDIIPQQQCAHSVTCVDSSISVNQEQSDRTQEIPNQLGKATTQFRLTNMVVDKNSAPSACPNSVQLLNSLQEPPENLFQFQVTPKEITSPTVPNYAQKPFTTPIPTTYSVFTDLQNLNLGSSPYHLQSDSSTVEADVSSTIITTVSSPPQSSLSSDTVVQEPELAFSVTSITPKGTSMVQIENNTNISVVEGSSAIIDLEKSYSNFEIMNTVSSDNVITGTGTGNPQFPINLVINVPPVNVPAPNVMILPEPSSSPVPSSPSECAPMVPQFVPTPMMPIIVDISKSKLKSLLPTLLIYLLRDGGSCNGGCSCNCGSSTIPIAYPIPIPTNCPIVKIGRRSRQKSSNGKSKC